MVHTGKASYSDEQDQQEVFDVLYNFCNHSYERRGSLEHFKERQHAEPHKEVCNSSKYAEVHANFCLY